MASSRRLAEYRDFEPRETQSMLVVEALAGSALKATLEQTSAIPEAGLLAKHGGVYAASLTYPEAYGIQPTPQALVSVSEIGTLSQRIRRVPKPELRGMLFDPRCRQVERVGALLLATVLSTYNEADYASIKYGGVYDLRAKNLLFSRGGLIAEPYIAKIDGKPVPNINPQHIATLRYKAQTLANSKSSSL